MENKIHVTSDTPDGVQSHSGAPFRNSSVIKTTLKRTEEEEQQDFKAVVGGGVEEAGLCGREGATGKKPYTGSIISAEQKERLPTSFDVLNAKTHQAHEGIRTLL